MRILLTITLTLLVLSADLFAQNDFLTLDKKTYDFYFKGDYKNLKKTADAMLLKGIDYYYLRMRLGMLAYNKQLYSSAFKQFSRALKFNPMDTISREYIYYSYLFSGRKPDADFYLMSIPDDKKNNALKSLGNPVLSPAVYLGSSASGYDVPLHLNNNLYYEAVKSSLSMNAGFETCFLSRFKGTFAFTHFMKTGTVYSADDVSGKDLNFNQNQVYAKLTGYVFPGWEFSGFGHIAFYTDAVTQGPPGNRRTINVAKTEYVYGAGISKNGWKIRTGANFSLSNFSNSNQIRGEAYLTYLPFGNLNLYLTSGWMGQTDTNWGGTYQVNEEIGLKVFKFLWLESGIIKGTSFLYARNQGSFMNNSFQIPATTIYGNFVILPGNHFVITITPLYIQNFLYSQDLTAYTMTDKQTSFSSGGTIKITYKIK